MSPLLTESVTQQGRMDTKDNNGGLYNSGPIFCLVSRPILGAKLALQITFSIRSPLSMNGARGFFFSLKPYVFVNVCFSLSMFILFVCMYVCMFLCLYAIRSCPSEVGIYKRKKARS